MGTLWKIALRNVFRHGRRTAITAIVMMMGIGFYIVYDAVIAGMDRLAIDTMVHYTAGFLKVRTPAYVADETGTPLDYGIPDPEGTAAKILKAAPTLTAVAPRTLFIGQASNYVDAEPVLCAAVDPERDARVFDLAGNITKGAWLSGSGGQAKGVVVSADLARDLGLQLGGTLVLSARTIYDNDNADEFTIVGIADPGLSLSAKLYMDYADARAFLGDGLPVTELDASAPRAPNLDLELSSSAAAATAVRAAFPALNAQPIGETAKDYLAIRNSKQKGTFMIVLVILLIAAVGIVNTILMSVYSRVREIGVLRAYGMTAKDIKKLFVREGLIIGAIGSLAGLVMGGGFVAWLHGSGMSLGAMFNGLDLGAFPANGVLYAEWRPSAFVTGLVFGLVASWLAARSPAKRAARLEPTDALHFV
ncbi:MAG TPA: FtsX-like permease family protein [Rectinemataceae bacterium]|nr:FtsX-like permease family protein [Rectinemataceae bacterium]